MSEHPEELATHLAENLRAIRGKRGLSQAQLAKLATIPRSTLASVESGQGNPTLGVLSSISSALKISIEELLSRPRKRAELHKRGSLPSPRTSKRGVTVEKLLPHPIAGMAIERMSFSEGGRLAGVPHRPGTYEYLYCALGKITLFVEGERFELDKGDVAAFAGDQKHGYHAGGRGRAVGFSVVTFRPLGS
jgi:DNA-binding XRE family transcriptional regulator